MNVFSYILNKIELSLTYKSQDSPTDDCPHEVCQTRAETYHELFQTQEVTIQYMQSERGKWTWTYYSRPDDR